MEGGMKGGEERGRWREGGRRKQVEERHTAGRITVAGLSMPLVLFCSEGGPLGGRASPSSVCVRFCSSVFGLSLLIFCKPGVGDVGMGDVEIGDVGIGEVVAGMFPDCVRLILISA